jgi:thiol-disulfide isomerase/thioredoxin
MGGEIPIPGQAQPTARPPAATTPAGAAPRPGRKINWWVAAAFVLIGAAAVYVVETYKVFWTGTVTASTNHPSVGKTPAVLELEPLNTEGPPVTLASLRGDMVVLNLWGTWCPPCRGEMATMAELARQWSQHRVRVLAVSCLQNADDEAVEPLREASEKFLSELGVQDLTVYRDPDHKTRDALAAIGAFDGSYPTTVILGADGRVRAVFRGYHIVQSRKGINAVLTQELQR